MKLTLAVLRTELELRNVAAGSTCHPRSKTGCSAGDGEFTMPDTVVTAQSAW